MENWMLWAAGAAFFYYFFLRSGVPAEGRLSPGELRDALGKEKDLQLIDVRSGAEFGGGHLAGARNIPVEQIASRLGDLRKDQPLVVYCLSGRRSARALQELRGAGFAQAKHMEGGLSAWQGAGLPVQR